MITPELLDFLRAQLDARMSASDIEELLLREGGWDKKDIAEAMAEIAPSSFSAQVQEKKDSRAEPLNPKPIVFDVKPSLNTKTTEFAKENSAVDNKKFADDFLGIFKNLTTEEGSIAPSFVRPTISTDNQKALGDSAVDRIKLDLDKIREAGNAASVALRLADEEDERADSQSATALEKETMNILAPEEKKPITAKRTMISDLAAMQEKKSPKPVSVPVNDILSIAAVPLAKEKLPKINEEVKREPSSTPSPFMISQKKTDEEQAAIFSVTAPYEVTQPKREEKSFPSVKDILLNTPDTKTKPIPSAQLSSLTPPPPPLASVPHASSVLSQPVETPLIEKKIASIDEAQSKNISKKAIEKTEVPAQPSGKKKIVIIAAIAGILLLLVGGGLFAYTKYRGPDPTVSFQNALTQFFGLHSFNYSASGSTHISLSRVAENGVERNGLIDFNATSTGSLKSGEDGYGDGIHNVFVQGKLQSGNFGWETAVDSDVRIIGRTLYFHFRSFPAESKADPETLKTYWIRVDLTEVARELRNQGITINEENYGVFSGGAVNDTFLSLLRKNMPFVVDGKITDKETAKEGTYHYRLKTDPKRMLDLATALIDHYSGENITITEEERVRVINAFEKVSGEIWISQSTGNIVSLFLSLDFDDDILGFRIKGPVALSFDFSEFNKDITIVTPSPAITLEDFRVRNDNYKKLMDTRARDQLNVEKLHAVIQALSQYYSAKGRYPTNLSDLTGENSVLPDDIKKDFLSQVSYASYADPEILTKKGQCTAKSKTCDFYHIGINLHDMTHPLLSEDADRSSAVSGNDTAGCGLEKDVSCYDLIAPASMDAAVDKSIAP